MADPVRYKTYNCYLYLSRADQSAPTLSAAKHPAFFMSVCLLVSNGLVMPLMRFHTKYCLAARFYEARLGEGRFPGSTTPWICNLSLFFFSRVVPQHTHPIDCIAFCKRENFHSGGRTSCCHSRQTLTHWTTPSARTSKPRHAKRFIQTKPP